MADVAPIAEEVPGARSMGALVLTRISEAQPLAVVRVNMTGVGPPALVMSAVGELKTGLVASIVQSDPGAARTLKAVVALKVGESFASVSVSRPERTGMDEPGPARLQVFTIDVLRGRVPGSEALLELDGRVDDFLDATVRGEEIVVAYVAAGRLELRAVTLGSIDTPFSEATLTDRQARLPSLAATPDGLVLASTVPDMNGGLSSIRLLGESGLVPIDATIVFNPEWSTSNLRVAPADGGLVLAFTRRVGEVDQVYVARADCR